MNKVAVYLNRNIDGNVFEQDSILEAYSMDHSVLKIRPRFVALPESTEDIQKLARFTNQLALKNYKLPIAVRGSGLDTTGADLTSGLVISTEKLNEIKEIDSRDRLVHVQSGVTLGQLNSALAPHGLFLPIHADPRETIGGLIANCPTDSYAARYGGIMNYIDRVEIVLANGSCLQTARFSRHGFNHKKSLSNAEGSLYRDLNDIMKEHSSTIESLANYRNLAGYPSIYHVSRNEGKVFDPLPLLFGSQGTLGIITEVILRAELIPPAPEHLLVSFNSFRAAHEFMSYAKKLKPLEINFCDLRIIKSVEKFGKKIPVSTRLSENGFLVYLAFSDNARTNRKKVSKCIDFLPKTAHIITDTPQNAEIFRGVRSAISCYLNDDSDGEHAPVVSDIYIPSDELSTFITELRDLEEKFKTSLPLYGSFGTSIYSIRPGLQISTDAGRRFAVLLMSEINKLLQLHYGYLSGGNPEGRLKALLTNHELTPAEKKLYRSIKDAFDPNHILAPDIKLDADPRTTANHFRTSATPYIVI